MTKEAEADPHSAVPPSSGIKGIWERFPSTYTSTTLKSLRTRGDKNTSLPQHHAGLLPGKAILNTPQLEVSTCPSSFCYEQKELVN